MTERYEGGKGGMRDEARSDEWKVISYVERRYVAFAVASLQPASF